MHVAYVEICHEESTGESGFDSVSSSALMSVCVSTAITVRIHSSPLSWMSDMDSRPVFVSRCLSYSQQLGGSFSHPSSQVTVLVQLTFRHRITHTFFGPAVGSLHVQLSVLLSHHVFNLSSNVNSFLSILYKWG